MSLFTLLACGGLTVEPAPPGSEVVVIVLDTLRADAVAGFGAETAASPFLARLGDEGVRFTSAWSTSSWTAPSTASLFTGRYPTEIGVVTGMMAMQRLGESYELNRIPRELETLPMRFSAAGFQTVGLASNPNIGDELGFSAGFDHFVYDPSASVEDLARELKRVPASDGQRFTYLHLNDVHAPYEPGWRWSDGADTPRQRYEAELRYLDHHLGALYDEMGWSDDLVVVLADHGEEFFEHGARGHGTLSLHREVTQIPMIWHGPELAPAEVADPISLIDVLPTLASVVPLEPDAGWSGTSLKPALEGTALPERSVFHHRRVQKVGEPAQELWGVTDSDWRYLRSGPPGELFATTDRLEERDLAVSRPDAVAPREAALHALEQKVRTVQEEAVQRTQTDAEAEMLRALGYVE